MNEPTEKDVHSQSEDAFGVFTQDPGLANNFRPGPEIVESPMSSEDSYMRCHCTSCNRKFELTEEGAKEVAANESLELPEDVSRSVLVFASCDSCKSSLDVPVAIESF